MRTSLSLYPIQSQTVCVGKVYYLTRPFASAAADAGLFAVKKVLVQTEEQLELVKQEIHVMSLFNHPNLLPLVDHAIISVKVSKLKRMMRNYHFEHEAL